MLERLSETLMHSEQRRFISPDIHRARPGPKLRKRLSELRNTCSGAPLKTPLIRSNLLKAPDTTSLGLNKLITATCFLSLLPIQKKYALFLVMKSQVSTPTFFHIWMQPLKYHSL